MGDWIDKLTVGGKYTGVALLGYSAYRLLTFVANFLAGRYDIRQARLDRLDERLAQSLGKRLDHLEQAEIKNQGRIQLLEGWLAAMAGELRAVDPENPRLKDLTEALRLGIPIEPPNHELDMLLQQAARQAEQRERRK